MEYRNDIAGLRAVAVLAVALFHARIPGFSGGFVGVDVFFVISGYLITSIIFLELGDGSFTFSRFYARRIRRLLPALVPVVIACAVFAYFSFSPLLLEKNAKALLAFLGAGSNWWFLAESGYFDQAAETKLFLHTWSLSIEEQFYLLLPGTLFLMRSRPTLTRVMLVAAMLLSLLYSAFLVWSQSPDTAYFHTASRMWELLAGSVLAFVPMIGTRRALAMIAQLLGIGAICATVYLYSDATPFPGLAAVPPVIGTALLIYFGRTQTAITDVLGCEPFQAIGKVSYSLYLWHWPCLVFVWTLWPDASLLMNLAALAVALVLATAFYMLIENPTRKSKTLLRPRRAFAVLAASTLILGGAGATAATDGLPERFGGFAANLTVALHSGRIAYDTHPDRVFCLVQQFQSLDAAAAKFDKKKCLALDEPGRPRVLVFGDSHANHLMAGLRARFPGAVFGALTSGQCAPDFFARIIVHNGVEADGCRFILQLAKSEFASWDFDVVVMSGDWARNVYITPQGVIDTARFFQSQGAEIVFVGPSPEIDVEIVQLIAANKGPVTPYNFAEIVQRHINPATPTSDQFWRQKSAEHGFRYLSLWETLCPRGLCAQMTSKGEPIFFDGSHFSPVGSEFALHTMPEDLLASTMARMD